MSHGETLASVTDSGSVVDKTCRTAFLKLMSLLPQGVMEIRENGTHVATYGKPDDTLHAIIDIQHIKAYRQLLLGGSIAAGETYMDKLWTTPDLTSVIRIFARNLNFRPLRLMIYISTSVSGPLARAKEKNSASTMPA